MLYLSWRSTVQNYLKKLELIAADIYQNKRRDRLVARMGMSAEEAEREGKINAEEDMTDVENLHFRYSLWRIYTFDPQSLVTWEVCM